MVAVVYWEWELAEVYQALADSIEFCGFSDAVKEKIREDFDSQWRQFEIDCCKL